MRIRRISFGLLLLAAVAACDESPVALPEATGVTVAAANMALAVGDEAPIAAQVVDQTGRVMQGQAVVFSTDNASVATVGANGMVRGVSPGTANVAATHGGTTATVKVTVTAATMTVALPRAAMALAVGDQAPVAAQVVDAGGRVLPGAALAYSTDNPSVATVGTDGTIRGVAPGTATIGASYGTSTGTVRVTVTSASVTVRVPGTTLSLAVGDASPVGAQVLDAQGRVVPGAVLAFSTDNPAVAAVGTDGVVRGVTPGTATVTAAYGSSSATVQVTVTANNRASVQSLQVMADSLVTDWRAGEQVVAVRALNGFGQAICPELTLRSSDVSIVRVRQAGPCRIEVDPIFTGVATITAEADGHTDTFMVRVTSMGQIAFISARPTANELVAGATVSYTVTAMDQQSRPIANQPVHFEVSVGSLSSNSVTTGADGTATVQWTIPTDLRVLGQNHWFAYRAPLSNGVVAWRDETVFINGASLADIVLYRDAGSGFTRLTQTSISVPAYSYVTVGASGLDQYGNVRMEDFTFPVTGSYAFTSCGGTEGTRHVSGIEYTCVFGTPSNVATIRAVAPGGQSRSVQVTFN